MVQAATSSIGWSHKRWGSIRLKYRRHYQRRVARGLLRWCMQRKRKAVVCRRSWRMVGSRGSKARRSHYIIKYSRKFDHQPRNIAERCPGGQTNNRAELIVRHLVPQFPRQTLNTSQIGHHPCSRERPQRPYTAGDSDGFAI